MLAFVVLAAPMTITGVVADARSHWTADGSRIVTDATVSTPSGDVVVSQLGGSVDGVTMRTFPTLSRPLERGMYVELVAHDHRDLAQQPHVIVDDLHAVADTAPFLPPHPP